VDSRFSDFPPLRVYVATLKHSKIKHPRSLATLYARIVAPPWAKIFPSNCLKKELAFTACRCSGSEDSGIVEFDAGQMRTYSALTSLGWRMMFKLRVRIDIVER
jgi:hypothetical protein